MVGCQECYCRAGRHITCESLICSLVKRQHLLKWKTTCSVTVVFSILTMVFIYSPSVPSNERGVFIPLMMTVSSIMACRLFRDLKLGLIMGPTPEVRISKLVFRDMGTVPRWRTHHSMELNSLGIQTGISETRDVCGDGLPPHRSIDSEGNRSGIPVQVSGCAHVHSTYEAHLIRYSTMLATDDRTIAAFVNEIL